MRPLTYVETGIAVALVVTGLVALHEHDAQVREQAVAAAVQKTQGDYQKQLQQLNADVDAKLKLRDEQHVQETKTLTDEFAAAEKNNAQMAALLQKLTGAPQPFVIQTPAATKDNPNPAPIVSIPQADFPSVNQYAKECEQCKLDRSKAVADLADRTTQMQNAQKEIESLKGENKELAQEIKGGNWVHRTLRTLLIAGCAGAGGWAGSPQGHTAAGIGAAAGAVACTIATKR